MNTSTECERVRMALMASLDKESGGHSAPHAQHLSTCASCQHWLKDLQAMTEQLQGLSYEPARVDLWTGVEGRIRQTERAQSMRLWPVGAVVLAWRTLQLFVDLPIPVLHPLVPLAAAVAALWLLAKDPLAIETSAPELQNRGI